jgi:hypothetical protein
MNILTALGLCSMLFVFWFTRRAYRDNTSVNGEQSRREAITEAWVNIVFGFTINFSFNLLLLPMMAPGGNLTLASNFWGGWIFTTISIVRQYAIRRWAAKHIRAFSGWLASRFTALA